MKTLANKLENLLEDEVQGLSCVSLSPQLQAYFNRLMEASEYRSPFKNEHHSRMENHFNSGFDEEYDEYDYFNQDFNEPFRFKRRIPSINVSICFKKLKVS